jgi:ABC-2 type transport system permease protein
MSKLRSLIRVGLKSNFGLAVLRYRLFKEKKDIWLVPLFGLAALSLVPAFYGLILLLKFLYVTLLPLHQERALLTLGILGGQLFILLFGLYYVISAFYFSKDLELLIPLPIKPYQVMASKFAVILVNEYLTVAAIVLPVLITFGVLARREPAYWINTLLIYLFLPVIPLAFVSLLVIAMMRLINFSRKKDALILIGSILLIAASLGAQLLINRSHNRGSMEDVAAFFSSPNSLLNRVGAKFPPSIWAAKALAGGWSGEGLVNMGLFLGTSLALLWAMLVLSERLFYRGLIGIGEISGRTRSLSRAEMSRRVASGRRPVRAVFLREWRIMNRTPIFLLNGVLVVIIVPAIFVLMAKTAGGRGDNAALLRLMTGAANSIVVILSAAAFMIFCGSLNGTASSTFSREGSQFWMSKVIPVSPRDQALAKFLHSYLITVLGILPASLVLLFVLHIKIAHILPAAGLALLLGFVLTAVGMIIDLARPLLDWTNPQKAIKQNLNVLFSIVADIAVLTILGYGIIRALKAGLSGAALLAILGVLLAGLAALSLELLFRFADKRYGEIEV